MSKETKNHLMSGHSILNNIHKHNNSSTTKDKVNLTLKTVIKQTLRILIT